MDMGRIKAAKIQRRTARPGFPGCRHRAGLGDLPEEVLRHIFSFLEVAFLRSPRLVCRSFRQATIHRITGLRLADGNKTSITDALRVFPGIASLTIQAPVTASSKAWPQSVSRLKSLVVYMHSTDSSLWLTKLLTHLTGLTSFVFPETPNSPNSELCSLQDIVAACPALQALELGARYLTLEPNRHECILRLTALRELKLYGQRNAFGSNVWEPLLPRLTCLTLLRALAYVCVKSAEDVAALAALTQLTSLGGMMRLTRWHACLQALTGLRRLSIWIPSDDEETDVLNLLLNQLPMSLEGLCFVHHNCWVSAEAWRVLSGMTLLDHLHIGSRAKDKGIGFWSLEATLPWCARLVGLRRLGLLGKPIGAPDLGLLARHLTSLEHLRLQLELFDGVRHLAALTRLTLLHLYKEPGDGTSAQAQPQGPPRFLTSLQRLRAVSLYWEVRISEERETVRCLATLAELERLNVTLVPFEKAPVSWYLRSHVQVAAALATESHQQQNGDMGVLGSQPCRGKREMGIRMLRPLLTLGSLQAIRICGGYMVDMKTWERIQDLRGRLCLPKLIQGSLEMHDFCSNALA